MAWTGNYTCTSFKQEILQKKHDFTTSTGDTFKIALYDEDASLTAATTAYSTTNEVTGTGYSAGGETLTNVTPATSNGKAYASFETVTFSTVTVSARGALIYNSSESNRAVHVLDFGRLITKTAADLVITFPTANATEAIIRVN